MNIVSTRCIAQKGEQKLRYISSLCDLSQMGPSVPSLQSVTQQPQCTSEEQKNGLLVYVYEHVSLALQTVFLKQIIHTRFQAASSN